MGSGGGGGSSGKIDYPTYMKDVHSDWLNQTGTDVINVSMTDVMNSALSSSPFTGVDAYDPDDALRNSSDAVADFQQIVAAMDTEADWESFAAVAADSTAISSEIEAYNDEVDAEMEQVIIPRYQRGMQDINAVMTSSFVIGQSFIEADGIRKKAQFASKLRSGNLTADIDALIKLHMAKIDYQKTVTGIAIEANRIKIVAKKEQSEQDLKIDEGNAKWDLEVFQYGSNLLASISGGTANPTQHTPPWQSAIGGGLSGAAMGAQLSSSMGYGSGTGAGFGAALGAAMAYFSSR
jgi:hypothetical protein